MAEPINTPTTLGYLFRAGACAYAAPRRGHFLFNGGRVPKRLHPFICIYSAFYVGLCDCNVIFMFLLEERTQQKPLLRADFLLAVSRRAEEAGEQRSWEFAFVNSSSDD